MDVNCTNTTWHYYYKSLPSYHGRLENRIAATKRYHQEDLQYCFSGFYANFKVTVYICALLAVLYIPVAILFGRILLQKKLRSSISILLVCNAVTDTLMNATFSFAPFLLCYYNDYDWPWDHIYLSFVVFLPLHFHISSVWITSILSLHRYLIISRPVGTKWWNSWNTRQALKTAAFVYVSSFIFVLIITNIRTIDTLVHGTFSEGVDLTKFILYNFAPIVIPGLVFPSLIMTITSILLIIALRNQDRDVTLGCPGQQAVRKDEHRRITICILAMTVFFLFANLPLALCIFTIIAKRNEIGSDRMLLVFTQVTLVILFTIFPFNFLIYSTMSRQFRDKLLTMLRLQFCRFPPLPRTSFQERTRETNM